MKDETIVLIFLIISITLIEIIALFKDIDGQILATVLSSLIGILGYYLGKIKLKQK